MADDAAGAVGGTATKARGAKKKGGKGKGGGRFKKMEKRRGTGIVVLDDDDVTDATASSAQNTQENASDGLTPVAEEGGDAPAADTGSSSGRRRRHRKERGEKSEGSHSKRDAIIRGDKIEEEFDDFENQETFRLKLKLAEANNRISYLEAQLMLLRQDSREQKERLDRVEEEKRALVKAMGQLQAT
ncbi:uncharacterized protein [Apostichopus japonicus]|uniref:uncharacterized protein isoform X1 n=1 Tax=Stichopus japonicus TaxID=307972 RepID=UPI003AB3DD3A